MKQKTLFRSSEYSSEFGGELLRQKRKSRRPLSTKLAMHLVLGADITKSGSLLKHRDAIDKCFANFATKFDVRIYKKSLVSNHIHVIALFSSRHSYIKFIRALTGALALKLKIKWRLRPWTRLIKWGRAFQSVIKYVVQNHNEAVGLIAYQPRRKRVFRI
jgi:REP element-mobilizing transposase RayT